ncbi:MAG: hypothetical protein HY606_06435 [Planctomycetes bacterium]|nr:hypothetical protein [Planctomycetota bacterium]
MKGILGILAVLFSEVQEKDSYNLLYLKRDPDTISICISKPDQSCEKALFVWPVERNVDKSYYKLQATSNGEVILLSPCECKGLENLHPHLFQFNTKTYEYDSEVIELNANFISLNEMPALSPTGRSIIIPNGIASAVKTKSGAIKNLPRELIAYNVETGRSDVIEPTREKVAYCPSWCRDGKSFLYVAKKEDFFSESFAIYHIYDSNSKEKQILGCYADYIKLSPSGDLAAGFTSEEALLYVFKVLDGKMIFKAKSAHGMYQRNADWSPDGELLVFANSEGAILSIWDSSQDKQEVLLKSFREEEGYNFFVANPVFTPDGRLVYFIAEDFDSGKLLQNLFKIDISTKQYVKVSSSGRYQQVICISKIKLEIPDATPEQRVEIKSLVELLIDKYLIQEKYQKVF